MPTNKKRMIKLNQLFVIDGSTLGTGHGVFLNDDFSYGTIKFKPNVIDLFDAAFLEGIAQEDIDTDDELTNNYGEDFWERKSNFDDIQNKKDAQKCFKFYNFDSCDIINDE